MAVFFVASYYYWPQTLRGQGIVDLVVWLIVGVGLMALLVYDLRWMLLPNKIMYKLIGFALVARLVDIVFFYGRHNFWLSSVLSVLVGGGIFYVLFVISSGEWIGGGDIKLGVLIGLMLASPAQSLLCIFLASVLGSLVAIPLLITGKAKRNTRVPFGPFLIVGLVITKLFGTAIVTWYRQKLLLL